MKLSHCCDYVGHLAEEGPWLLSDLGVGRVTQRRSLWEGVSMGGLGFYRLSRDVGRPDGWQKNHFGAGVAGTQAVAVRESGRKSASTAQPRG